jgi:hypothetical protein
MDDAVKAAWRAAEAKHGARPAALPRSAQDDAADAETISAPRKAITERRAICCW